MYNNGLVIGKFYPPHKGHAHLIREAAKQCTNLYVIVLGNRYESLTVDQRAAWLSQEFQWHTNVEVIAQKNDCPEDYNSDEIWKAQTELMRLALKTHGVKKIDCVFSSEAYGDEMGRIFDADSQIVDLERSAFHVSGTACRDEIVENWDNIILAAREEMSLRVIVVGAESTGTTTLARALTEHYKEQFPQMSHLEEYGRIFTELRLKALRDVNPEATMDDLDWKASHFKKIAQIQQTWENACAFDSPLVIADTDAFATQIWEERYTGAITDHEIHIPRRDLYLVTDHVGVDFEDDGYRDGKHLRADMTETFKERLTRNGHSWVLMTGDHETRLANAIKAINPLIEQRMTFSSPPWARKTVLS